MGEYKTPGVYIKEKNAFPNSIVEAETAIPVFIGLTEKALNETDSLDFKPMRISSITEYRKYFGGASTPQFTLSVIKTEEADKTLSVYDATINGGLKATLKSKLCTLYYNMVMFFANGGGTCYVISIGNYEKNLSDVYTDKSKETIFSNIKKVQDITMLVVPEAVNVDTCMNIYTDLLNLCDSKKYFVLLDIPLKKGNKIIDKPIETFREAIGTNNISYAAAYYPWLETSVLSDNDITGKTLTWDIENFNPDTFSLAPFYNVDSDVYKFIKDALSAIKKGTKTVLDKDGKTPQEVPLTKNELSQMENDLHNALMQNWPEYQLLAKKVKDYLNLLPPSAAMAGIYTMVDNTRGVWKAPANVSVNYVNKPSEVIDNKTQEEMNVPMDGKAVNAIRSFVGEGIKVWGARTLNGNSLDWRYINVRRTMTFLEESVKNAARAYVFEPNDANTWINMKCMIENFLRSVWKRGGLAGASPEDAYEVHVGLGDTMTAEDILEGIMRITVLVAISHPAEFIEITFQQQMQKS